VVETTGLLWVGVGILFPPAPPCKAASLVSIGFRSNVPLLSVVGDVLARECHPALVDEVAEGGRGGISNDVFFSLTTAEVVLGPRACSATGLTGGVGAPALAEIVGGDAVVGLVGVDAIASYLDTISEIDPRLGTLFIGDSGGEGASRIVCCADDDRGTFRYDEEVEGEINMDCGRRRGLDADDDVSMTRP